MFKKASSCTGTSTPDHIGLPNVDIFMYPIGSGSIMLQGCCPYWPRGPRNWPRNSCGLVFEVPCHVNTQDNVITSFLFI